MKTEDVRGEIKYAIDNDRLGLLTENLNSIIDKILISYAKEACKEKDEKIKMLEYMIENGLGWDDMKNDITMPNEI